jgi:putative aldouronate transport system permease protein
MSNANEIVPIKQRAKKADRLFDTVVVALLILWGFATLYPIFYVIISSISSAVSVDLGNVIFYPIDVNLASYHKILFDPEESTKFWNAMANSAFYTFVGTAYSMLISTTAAYALSRPTFRLRKPINIMLSFTLWFQAGFIPLYLNYANLGVVNDRWGIIVSFGVQAYFIILLRSYFESVPPSLQEAARIDGANEFRIFTSVYVPLSKPALATIAVYYGVSRRNGFFWSMVLLKQQALVPVQVYLQQMIIQEQINLSNVNSVGSEIYSFTTLKYALIVLSIIPVAVAFPFLQRYFSRGIMLGGVKE